ncbi:histidine phosphatase family protein [Heyndrickxia sp. NPDC080065]|uniref:histidine phosphatase family protein n=1 Tax=Heyndrickxia sp. NPDC080065 TaxID=3390568 RepID=UPI003CFE2EB8
MKTIYLVRHCQAEGQSREANLTELGVEQSKNLADFLLTKNIEYIISSPFKRAYSSITPLAESLGMEIVKDERLSERVLSSVDHPDWLNMLKRTFDDLDLCFEGGESSRNAANRAINVINDILERPYQTSVIVTHGNLMSLILNNYNKHFHFDQWKELSNPDVYQLDIFDQKPKINRVWK